MTPARRLLCAFSIALSLVACIDDPFFGEDDDDEVVDGLIVRTKLWDNWWARSPFALTEMGGDTTEFVKSSREFEIDGRVVQLEFEGTVSWLAEADCVASDGSGRLSLAELSWDATLAGFVRCADACPNAGIVSLSAEGETTTLIFDGRNEATLLHSDRDAASVVALDCDRAP